LETKTALQRSAFKTRELKRRFEANVDKILTLNFSRNDLAEMAEQVRAD
jgi:hypothetical protein